MYDVPGDYKWTDVSRVNVDGKILPEKSAGSQQRAVSNKDIAYLYEAIAEMYYIATDTTPARRVVQVLFDYWKRSWLRIDDANSTLRSLIFGSIGGPWLIYSGVIPSRADRQTWVVGSQYGLNWDTIYAQDSACPHMPRTRSSEVAPGWNPKVIGLSLPLVFPIDFFRDAYLAIHQADAIAVYDDGLVQPTHAFCGYEIELDNNSAQTYTTTETYRKWTTFDGEEQSERMTTRDTSVIFHPGYHHHIYESPQVPGQEHYNEQTVIRRVTGTIKVRVHAPEPDRVTHAMIVMIYGGSKDSNSYTMDDPWSESRRGYRVFSVTPTTWRDDATGRYVEFEIAADTAAAGVELFSTAMPTSGDRRSVNTEDLGITGVILQYDRNASVPNFNYTPDDERVMP